MSDPMLTIYLEQLNRYPILPAPAQLAAFRALQADVLGLWLHLATVHPKIRLRAVLEQCEIPEPGKGEDSPVDLGHMPRASREALCRWAYGHDVEQRWLDHVVASLGDEETRAHLRRIEQQRDNLCRHNLRLVVAYAAKLRMEDLEMADRVQFGNLGLMKAVRRYRTDRGTKFSTFAVWWIKHHIRRGVMDTAKAIRIPVHVYDVLYKAGKARGGLAAERGEAPSVEEIARAIRVPTDKLALYSRMHRQSTLSMDHPLDEGGDGPPLGSLLASPKDEETGALAEVEHQQEAKRVRALLRKVLTRRERDVLAQRFGLDDGVERTFREIGDADGFSRERIRQIQNIALAKLRGAIRRQEKGL